MKNNYQYYKAFNRKKLRYILYKFFPHVLKNKYILVGGTNGKGTTSYLLQQLLISKYHQVGLVTSPHLCCLNERIRINEKPISLNQIEQITTKYVDIFVKYNLSFYEIILFVALEYFTIKKTKMIVLEIGIGGAYDACNIVNPLVSLITNVALDHTNLLGNTLKEIAHTKSFIGRKNKPLIIGKWITKPAYKEIKKMAKKRKYNLISLSSKNVKKVKTNFFKDYKNLATHFIENYTLAIEAACLLGIKEKEIKRTLIKGINMPWGRQNRFILNDNNFILDGAHNLNSINSLFKSLPKKKSFICFFASKTDKDYYKELRLIAKDKRIKKIYLSTLMGEFVKWGEKGLLDKCETINEQWKVKLDSLINKKNKEDILCCGSLYFIGEIYKHLKIAEQTKLPFVYKEHVRPTIFLK